MKNEETISLIKHDFRRLKLIVLILCIGMMPIFCGGYCGYILVLLFPIVFHHGTKMSRDAFLISIFCVMYTFAKIINGYDYTPSSFAFDLFFPLIVFQTGNYVVGTSRYIGTPVLILSLMAIFLAIPAIYDCIADTISTGQAINVLRSVGNEKGEITRSATGYGTMLSVMNGSIAVIFFQNENKLDKILRQILILFSIGALFSTIHLLNRTGLVISAACILMAILKLVPSRKNNLIILVIVSLFLIAFLFFWGDKLFLSEALELYEARSEAESHIDNYEYGGRTALWAAGLSHIFSNPFGSNGLFVHGEITYAHNLWIDAGVIGGVVSAMILLVITLKGIISLKRTYRYASLNRFEKNLLIIFSVAMFLQASVEPVIEGVPQFFWMLVYLLSIIAKFGRMAYENI